MFTRVVKKCLDVILQWTIMVEHYFSDTKGWDRSFRSLDAAGG